MDKETFAKLVSKYTKQVEANAGAYRLKVLSFALLGYVFYALLLLATVGLLGGIVALLIFHPSALFFKLGLKAGIPILFLAWAMFGALRVRPYEPSGIAVTEKDAPELFALIEKLRQQLQVPPLDRVVLTDDFNASVVQNPRFGLFGTRSCLVLGMPLMQALGPDDLKVVIGHELGHLSGNHSRFSGWVYRAVRSYVQLLEQGAPSGIIEGFLGWYVPRLDALSFPLRRQNEYEADAAAASVAGKERAAQALVNVNVRAQTLGPFYKDVFQQTLVTPNPPAQLFNEWSARVRSQAPADAEQAFSEAMAETTGVEDTHPALADRVKALGAEVRIEELEGPCAAQALLGDNYKYLVDQTGYLWSSSVHLHWSQKHQQAQNGRQRLAALENKRSQQTLSADETFEYADLAEDLFPERDPLILFQAALELHPEHPGLRFAVGRLLIAKGDPAGVPLLEGLQSHRDADLRFACAALLASYYKRNKNDAAAEQQEEKARIAAATSAELERKHEELRLADNFVAHGLSEQQLAQLQEDLGYFKELKEVYLVKKLVEETGAEMYVLGYLTKLKIFGENEEESALHERLLEVVELPGEIWVFSLESNAKFQQVFARFSDSQII